MSKLVPKAVEFPATVVTELTALETELGGRQAIVGMLALAPLTQDLRYILGLLGDPKHDRLTLASICAKANILPGELLKHLQAAALLKGKVKAAQIISRGVEAVVKDVMEKAAPYTATCSTCLGTATWVPEPSAADPNPTGQPCPTCNATGVLVYQPDFEHQKLALELAQVLPKSGGLSITQQSMTVVPGSVGGMASSEALVKLQHLTDAILYGTGTVDGDVVEPEPPAEGTV